MIQRIRGEARDGKTTESSQIRGREVCHCDGRSEVGQRVRRDDVAGRAPKEVVKPALRPPLVDRSSARESNSDSRAVVARIAAVPA